MIYKKCVFFFTLFKLSLILASNNDCGGSKDVFNEIAYRFLDNTIPLRYQIYIDPCISDGNFSGYVHIDLFIINETKNITLHSQELEFCEEGVYLTLRGTLNDTYQSLKSVKNIELGVTSFQESDELLDDSSETLRPVQFIYYKKEQTVTLRFKEPLNPGRYSLEINYMGVINSEPVGIYRKNYKDPSGEKNIILLTNLHPTSARRMFPCYDDPKMKAELYFTIQTSLNFTTLTAFTPETYVDYKEGQRWTHYHPIANHSTYQLNFAVLNNMSNKTTIVDYKTYITYATASDLDSINLSHELYEKSIPLMEEFTDINYPLDTFRNLVLPENVEITTSSNLGLVTTKKSSASYSEQFGVHRKKDVVMKTTRNVASQWFNQLVSPESWKDAWLTEGLLMHMKYYLADKIMPEWRLKDLFVVWELQRRSFIPNKITDSPPLNGNVSDTPKDIQCLITRSLSTTSLSSSLIRMISHFLSEDIVRCGIKTFLKTNKYKSVKSDDFWEAIQRGINASNDERINTLNITEIMKTWTDTEFYPVVNVTRDYTNGTIELTQMPAVTFFDLAEKNETNKWWIPINYVTQSNLAFDVTAPSHWLKPDVEQLIIDNVDANDWVIFNVHQTGYYRVLYDAENWKRLSSYLNSENYRNIPSVNRAQIINDAVQFALKQYLDMGTFLELISYLERETDYVPWYDAQFVLSFLNYHLSNTHAFDSLKKFSVRLIAPLVDKIGYHDRPDDDFSTLMLRRISNHWACHFGYQPCWNNATKLLEAILDNKTSELGAIDLEEWARCVGLNGASIAVWDKVFKKYQDTLSEDTLIYLACSENSTILNQFLEMSILNNSVIPTHHVMSVFKSVCLYPAGDHRRMTLCLNFIHNNLERILPRLNNSNETFTHLLELLASEIRQKEQLDQFKRIIGPGKATFAAKKLEARLKQTENRVGVFEEKANYYEPFLSTKCP